MDLKPTVGPDKLQYGAKLGIPSVKRRAKFLHFAFLAFWFVFGDSEHVFAQSVLLCSSYNHEQVPAL
jgi:hypothetical protein